MSRFLVMLVLGFLAVPNLAVAAGDLYVPTLYVIHYDHQSTEDIISATPQRNTFETYVLTGGELGLPMAECKAMIDAWEAEHGPGMTAAAADGENAFFLDC